jgi:hypothetical protein
MKSRTVQTKKTLGALLKRPDLWLISVQTAVRLIPDSWWRRGPLPTHEYLEYRGSAVFGVPLAEVPANEFIRYLEWCKAFPGPIH